MFFTTGASAAIFTDATAAAQAERAERGGPEGCGMGLKPTLDIGERFSFAMHGVYMAYAFHTLQEKRNIMLTSVGIPDLVRDFEFCSRN